jgi:hypothetical protein
LATASRTTGRPPSITAIGWLFIAVGAGGILKDLWPLLTSDATQQLARLKAEGLSELGPAWTSRVLAAIGGVGLLSGRNWARWLLVTWMAFHIVLSVLHSMEEVLVHAAIFAPILHLLFRRRSDPYFRAGNSPPP